MRIVVDLETYGTRPGSAIGAIGAAKIENLDIVALFYERIDVYSCLGCGLLADAETLAWWRRQKSVARFELFDSNDARQPLPVVLGQFAAFIEGATEIYGKGPSFDCSLLAAAYLAARMELPWAYYNERCLRTARSMVELSGGTWKQVRSSVPHHALHDAKAEAEELILNVLYPLIMKGGKKG